MGKKLIVGNANCEHDNTEDIIDALEVVGDVYADRFGTPLSKETYTGKVFIEPSISIEEARSFVNIVIKKFDASGLKVIYV